MKTCASMLAGLLLAAAPLSAAERSKTPWWDKVLILDIYAGFEMGWAIPTGSVTGVTDRVEFPEPVAATDVYRTGVAGSILVGVRTEGWIFELDFSASDVPLTQMAQQQITGTANQDANAGTSAFDVIAAKRWMLASSERSHCDLFAGLALGWVGVHLDPGDGGTRSDDGPGLAVRTGLDYCFGLAAVRAACRYQIAMPWTTAPSTVAVTLGVLLFPF